MKFKKITSILAESYNGNSMSVFDIDDTLVVTSAKIKVYDPLSGDEFSLTPAQYNDYERKPQHKLDFTEFDDGDILLKGRPIEWVVKILVNTMKKQKAVGIITARGDKQIILDFLNKHGININPAFVFAIGDPKSKYTGDNAQKKQQAFEDLIAMGFKDFKFFDDNLENLKYAKDLEKKYSDVKVITKHIQSKWIPKFEDEQ